MVTMKTQRVRSAVVVLCLTPLVWLTWATLADRLGANPIEELVRWTGIWALNFLLISLAVTPLRKIPGWNALVTYRRMLGLMAFFYVCVHLSTYVGIDQFFAVDDIVKDVIKRPFITVGMVSFVLLIPLAVTSTDAMIRRLGGRRWRALHRLVYLIGIGGVVHYLWLVKADLRPPLIYAALLAVLLVSRLWWRYAVPQRRVAPSNPSRSGGRTPEPA